MTLPVDCNEVDCIPRETSEVPDGKKPPEVSESPDYEAMYIAASGREAKEKTRADRAVRSAQAAEARVKELEPEVARAVKEAAIASQTARAASERIEREVIPISKRVEVDPEVKQIQARARNVPRVKGHYDN